MRQKRRLAVFRFLRGFTHRPLGIGENKNCQPENFGVNEMPEESAAVLPFTAAEALTAWDAGKTLRAFRVNAERATQDQIYAAAFELLREGDLPASARDFENLTVKEAQSAHSIAFVAQKNGWAAMVQGHIHAKSPEITVKRPLK